MKILVVGEIVSEPGQQTVKKYLPKLISELNPDVVLVNAVNLTRGKGHTREDLQAMQTLGINYFTGGDHTFWQKKTDEIIDELPVVRPANYPATVPGKGHYVLDTGAKGKVLILNLMGRTSFSSTNAYLEDPFTTADRLLAEAKKDEDYKYVFVDFHAESTSEKLALAFYLDGRVDAFVGSHTHVPTADNFVLPNGTLYITDIGMTGIIDSVLGVKKDIIIKLFLTALNQRFEWEKAGRCGFRSVLLDLSAKTITRHDFYDSGSE